MTEKSRRGMQPEDIGRLRQVAETRVSPDGSQVAFTVTSVDADENKYSSRIWLAPADGSERARPFTSGPEDSVPRWSPDGRWLAFAVNGKEGGKICTLPVDHGGERVVVATWRSPVSELEWSPDSSKLAFVARDPDPETYGPPGEDRKDKDMPPRRVTRFLSRLDAQGWIFDRPSRVFVAASDGSSSPVPLTPGPFQTAGITWSPDSERIAFSSGRHDTWDLDWIVDLWSVTADGSEPPERLTGQEADYSFPAWSPDGTRIAFLRYPTPLDEPRHSQLGVLDLDTGERVELSTDLDRNCLPYGAARAPVWAGDELICGVENQGNVSLFGFAADGNGKPVAVVDGERWVSGWDWAAGTLSMAVTTPVTLPELVARPYGDGAATASTTERQLTNLTAPLVSNVTLAEPEHFVARSADGTEVPCWAMPPVGAEPGKRYPTLLNIHGGPFTSYGNKFFDEFQLEAGGGFGVLYSNPRGGSGYSEAWGRAIRWPECETDPGTGWGGVDFEDVMACIDEAAERFSWVDTDRLGVLGGSYGGYMTSWAISHTDRFKAAVSERACNNLLTLEVNSDIATAFRGFVGKSHLDDPAAYMRQSPITYVKDIHTPVLILHSEQDYRCPINQAEELFVALRLLGREPEMVRFPAESHELSRAGAPKHRIQRAELILDWFTKRLS